MHKLFPYSKKKQCFKSLIGTHGSCPRIARVDGRITTYKLIKILKKKSQRIII